jgi:4-amino-4-deoxy-L-arabinose transferase-like glycosyltransferase
MNKKLVLGLILLFGFSLRIYQLGHLELFGDEIDVGYHAYSLWKTGRDYSGLLLPTYIRSFAEWRAPLLMYVSAPFVGIIGLNSWGVRLAPALFGIINIYLIYKLVVCLTNDRKLGLVSGLILAVLPWHIHYSRTAFEVTLLLSLILAGTITFINKKYAISAVLFGLSFYSYNTANLFVPFLGLILIWLYKDALLKKFKRLFLPLVVFFLIITPITVQILNGPASGRFKLIGIFNDQTTVHQIVHYRNTGISSKVERVFHNKLTGWGSAFIDNYLTAFSPQFLFLNGDPNPRHSLPGWGQIYWIFLPFLVLGVVKLIRIPNSKFRILVFSWLLVSPIPSSLTINGGNQATRLFLMLPSLVILISYGIIKLFSRSVTKNILFHVTCYLLLVTCLIFYFHNYFIHYQKETYQNWHYGYQEAMSWLKNNQNDGRVFINNSREPALGRYLFWNQINPRLVHQYFGNDIIEKDILPGFSGFNFKNIYFGNLTEDDKIDWFNKKLDDEDLYLAVQGDEVPGDWDWSQEPPDGIKVVKTVNDPWQKPLFYWITKSSD